MNDIYNQREEQIKKANNVYNQLVNESNSLTNNQSNQIDTFINDNTDRINQSISNNVSNLTNANNYMAKDYENELEGATQDYQRYTSLPINETTRIMAQNSMQQRQLSATESRQQAYQEYLNQSERAKITGDATIAQLALNSLKEKLNLMDSMNQYNSSLMQNRLSNEQNLDNVYWQQQQAYNNASNSISTLKENQRQFNETLAYQKAQDKVENALNEKKYKLALSNAESSASRGYSSTSSRNYSSNSGGNYSNSINLTNNSNNNTTDNGTYYCNYTPRGLSEEGRKAFDKLSSKSNKNGYVTLSDIENGIKGLNKTQQEIISSAFKSGSIKPIKTSSKELEKSKKSWTKFLRWY